MYYFVEVACVIAEMWMIHLFLGGFFHKRALPVLFNYLLYSICGIILTFLSLIEGMVYLRLAFTTISVLLASVTLFRARVIPGLISGVAFCAIFAATDIVAALIFQMFGVQTEELMAEHIYRSLYLIVCHIIMLGLILLVCLINKNNKKYISLKILLPVAPCWIISILLCFLLTWQCFSMGYHMHPLFVFVLLGLLYTSIIVIYYTNRIYEQAQEKKDWEIAEHHYAMQQEYYDQLRIQQEETRAIWHDIKKYLKASKVETTEGALAQVQEMLDSISCVVDINNRIVSVILNEYMQTTRAAQIVMELDVQVPDELFVTAADLYVLIGNTMDNAIEACAGLPAEKRKIVLTLRTHNHILFYELKNPFDESHFNRLRSSCHGFGLKNVERCVDKYNGKLDIIRRDGVFYITAHLNSI